MSEIIGSGCTGHASATGISDGKRQGSVAEPSTALLHSLDRSRTE